MAPIINKLLIQDLSYLYTLPNSCKATPESDPNSLEILNIDLL